MLVIVDGFICCVVFVLFVMVVFMVVVYCFVGYCLVELGYVWLFDWFGFFLLLCFDMCFGEGSGVVVVVVVICLVLVVYVGMVIFVEVGVLGG